VEHERPDEDERGAGMNEASEACARELARRLGGRRFGVVGVGNVFKGDDGAGPALVAALEGRFEQPTVDASEVPENYGGWVVKENLDSVVFVDAVEFGGEPGEFRIIPLDKLMVSASSTHRLSLHYVILYLKNEWEGDAVLVGVQPKSCVIGDGLSSEVSAGVEGLAAALVAAGSGT
jgi:hydrogenase 3 maturation protease